MAYQLWTEEEDKAVWHRATRSKGSRFVVACGWEMKPRMGRLCHRNRMNLARGRSSIATRASAPSRKEAAADPAFLPELREKA